MCAVQSNISRFDVSFDEPGSGGGAEKAVGQLVSGDYFSVLGVPAVAGREFSAEDDKVPGGRPVAVMSYRYWKRRFALDPGVIGKTMRLNKTRFTIIGVTPPEFFGEAVGVSPDFWLPMMMQAQVIPGRSYLRDPETLWLQIVARLKPDISQQQAEAGINVEWQQTLAAQAGAERLTPERRRDLLDQRIALHAGSRGVSTVRQQFSEPLLILMAVVGLVLLIACANVANLLLARAAARRREIGVRLALGAGRLQLIRQLLTESVLLALLGGALGLLFASWGSHLLLVLVSNGSTVIPLDLHPDGRVLGFTGAVSLLTGILFGLAPALRATAVDLTFAIRDRQAGGRRHRLGKALVVSQVALSLILLIGSGLFVRSLRNLLAVDLGYSREGLLLIRIDPVAAGYGHSQIPGLYRQLLERIAAIPGVRGASLSHNGLFSGSDSVDPISVEGYTPPNGKNLQARYDQVGPNYFSALGIPMLKGREIGPEDTENSPRVGVINESLARFYFPDTDPIGKRITDEFPSTRADFRVVGVVRDVKNNGLRRQPPRRFYVPFFHPIGQPDTANLVIRTAGGQQAVLAAIRREVQAVSKDLPVLSARTLSELVDQSLIQERLITVLSSFFGAVAALLASIGLYGIMAYAVARRTNEIGIRMALGAQKGDVIRLVLQETLLLVLSGIVLGVPAALAAARLVSSRLFGLTPADPLTITAATLLLLAVAVLAGYLPARRASRVDPMVALRYE